MGASTRNEQHWRLIDGLWYNFDVYHHWSGDRIIPVRGPLKEKKWTKLLVTKYVIKANGTKQEMGDDYLKSWEKPDEWDDPSLWWDYL